MSVLTIAGSPSRASRSGRLLGHVHAGLADKFVWPIATGGSPAHTLAIDYALRPVLAALGAQHIGRSVFALDADIETAPNGGGVFAASLVQRLDAGVGDLLAWRASRQEQGGRVPIAEVAC